jgi:predicted GNAT superfamily acetyltransferase
MDIEVLVVRDRKKRGEGVYTALAHDVTDPAERNGIARARDVDKDRVAT